MLIEFRVENHRSLRDEQVLTMQAGQVGDPDDDRPRLVPGYAQRLLPVAAIYGANASGKSNVLDALVFMYDAVLWSHRTWSPDKGIHRDPFAWGPKRKKPTLFEVTVVVGDVRYQYGFTASSDRFLEEWLYAWPNDRKQTWFSRYGDAFKFGDNLKGENKQIEGFTRDNALFLSTAAQHNHKQITPIFSWFESLRTINCDRQWHILGRDSIHDDKEALSRFKKTKWLTFETLPEPVATHLLALLKNADLGIVDLRVKPEAQGSNAPLFTMNLYEFKHRAKARDAWLDFEQESKGTKHLFYIAIPLLLALTQGRTILVDELETSLHPAIAQNLVRLFNDPKTNPRNAQLIFTTHDTNLLGTTLGEPVLRRDQVWLTEKDGEGATVLYPLTDFKPRKAENIERGYLQGRYGAVPFLGDFVAATE
ncbi:MAG: ATP-binding protein [Paludisphaera borealis]|uniref:AAA family ATPase n=1 Tax=Paludisphaera borealis TaxID=1387353 RepID=UPI00284F7BA7|nr:ATP-binding protein [Paludisphaera borealis]MDR3621321.1 ATP-binding protein [Paludisphaera borealis]